MTSVGLISNRDPCAPRAASAEQMIYPRLSGQSGLTAVCAAPGYSQRKFGPGNLKSTNLRYPGAIAVLVLRTATVGSKTDPLATSSPTGPLLNGRRNLHQSKPMSVGNPRSHIRAQKTFLTS